ncbi:hypothetical protein CERSUDRAFT_78005 [Gelatoporia subvermispora B]|uniref:Uncharacterized protein n=1 Tax=Ceriporiopsis subvermispora (strain B) TaxID=914234 RepID=M2Q428_CERS8|nr:hypothetical protein CERSUDRAFT_78005 [Gelatoporia subvermispora B]
MSEHVFEGQQVAALGGSIEHIAQRAEHNKKARVKHQQHRDLVHISILRNQTKSSYRDSTTQSFSVIIMSNSPNEGLKFPLYVYNAMDKFYRDKQQSSKEYYTYPLWLYLLDNMSVQLNLRNLKFMSAPQMVLDAFFPFELLEGWSNQWDFLSPQAKLGGFVRSPGPELNSPNAKSDSSDDDPQTPVSPCDSNAAVAAAVQFFEARSSAIPDFVQLIGRRISSEPDGFDLCRAFLICENKAMPNDPNRVELVVNMTINQVERQVQHLFDNQCPILNPSSLKTIGVLITVGKFWTYNEYHKKNFLRGHMTQEERDDPSYRPPGSTESDKWPIEDLRELFGGRNHALALTDTGLGPSCNAVMTRIMNHLRAANSDIFSI